MQLRGKIPQYCKEKKTPRRLPLMSQFMTAFQQHFQTLDEWLKTHAPLWQFDTFANRETPWGEHYPALADYLNSEPSRPIDEEFYRQVFGLCPDLQRLSQDKVIEKYSFEPIFLVMYFLASKAGNGRKFKRSSRTRQSQTNMWNGAQEKAIWGSCWHTKTMPLFTV
jgi:hypothetical protein